MKKIMLTIATMLTMGIGAYANAVKFSDYRKLDISSLAKTERIYKDYDLFAGESQLGMYIDLSDASKAEKVSTIYNKFCTNMLYASTMGHGKKKERKVVRSIDNVLFGMRHNLDGIQYRNFLKMLNKTLQEHGLQEEIDLYCEKSSR